MICQGVVPEQPKCAGQDKGTLSPSGRQIRNRYIWPLACVACVFIISRVVSWYVGVRYDTHPLVNFWQFVDPDLLRHRLLQSVFYLHSQPPLFNLYLGIILKLFPHHEGLAFHATYVICGLLLTSAICLLLLRLGTSAGISIAAAVVFSISSASILYENWLYYTYPLATMLVLAALCLHRYLQDDNQAYGFLFFLLISCVVLTRGLFHIAWMVIVIGFLLYCRRASWKRTLLAALIPFMLAFLVYAKNAVVFGSVSSSSWLGFSFSKMVTSKVPEQERRRMVERGEVSALLLTKTFRPLDEYRKFIPPVPKTGIPVLDQEYKSTGRRNFNNIAYVGISNQFLRDSIVILRKYPQAYAHVVVSSYYLFLLSPSDYVYVDVNREKLGLYDRLSEIFLYGRMRHDPRDPLAKRSLNWKLANLCWFVVVAYSFWFFCSLSIVRRSIKGSPADRNRGLTLLFILVTVVWTAIVGNCFENGENYRYRYMVDPLVIIVLGYWLDQKLKSLFRS